MEYISRHIDDVLRQWKDDNMRTLLFMRTLICMLLLMLLPPMAFAQTVTNVTARQAGNTVEVTYSLDQSATMSLLLSQDGGKNYEATPRSVTGDVGKVQAGNNKKIVWNLLEDAEDWDISYARFKVAVKREPQLTFTVKGVSFTMNLVEGGTFTMGCTSEQDGDCYDDEIPAHQVTLSDYYIGQTEVTQGLWKAVMDTNPSAFSKGDNYPVERVNWDDCRTFIDRLNSLLSSQLDGAKFALPTEAEWEFAARGGNKSQHYKYAGSNYIDNVAWYYDNSGINSGSATHPVAGKSPNELGLYDMSGNVWEWCHDGYTSYSSAAQTNPTGGSPYCLYCVCRGGSWFYDAKYCRVLSRNRTAPSNRYEILGLRLVLLIVLN